mmetsp:Transcript_5594/g.12912  ORF Transcript_5594/g.12912 Transcript_5594/m.12912 type:complete len:334 (-) Transcript_5594:1372-2373(-)
MSVLKAMAPRRESKTPHKGGVEVLTMCEWLGEAGVTELFGKPVKLPPSALALLLETADAASYPATLRCCFGLAPTLRRPVDLAIPTELESVSLDTCASRVHSRHPSNTSRSLGPAGALSGPTSEGGRRGSERCMSTSSKMSFFWRLFIFFVMSSRRSTMWCSRHGLCESSISWSISFIMTSGLTMTTKTSSDTRSESTLNTSCTGFAATVDPSVEIQDPALEKDAAFKFPAAPLKADTDLKVSFFINPGTIVFFSASIPWPPPCLKVGDRDSFADTTLSVHSLSAFNFSPFSLATSSTAEVTSLRLTRCPRSLSFCTTSTAVGWDRPLEQNDL